MTSKVSVVIPAYKARNYLAEALDSVALQSALCSEILVIDDCSPESIDDIIDSHCAAHPESKLRVIRHDENRGLGAARNTGISEANGDWIAFLDHDDFWAPDHLQNLLSEAERSSADLAFCTVKQFKSDPEDSMGLWGPAPEDLGRNMGMALLRRSFITPSATLVRRSLLLDIGGFSTDPRVHMCEDQDLWLRLHRNGTRFVHAQRPTCYYRKHDDAATSRLSYMSYQSAYVMDLHASTVKGPWLGKRALVANKWWQAWVAFLQTNQFRWDVLGLAIWNGLLVPWEIARGIKHTLSVLIEGKASKQA